MKALSCVVVVFLVGLLTVPAGAEKATHRVDRNVVYGYYSGLALLMDIHHPGKPNGYGIVHISGSGFLRPLGLDAPALKESAHVTEEAVHLVNAGFTVFTINHRAIPRFQYPTQIEDCQRAVRFVRHHADEYGIKPDRIGAMGGSSGGYLANMLGVLDGEGDPEDESEINRLSAKVQCVVARAAPTMSGPDRFGFRGLYLGGVVHFRTGPGSIEQRLAKEATPLTHVSSDDPPTLLLHGDADMMVSPKESEKMAEAFRDAGVTTQVVAIPGSDHGPHLPGAKDPMAARMAMVNWFNTHLKEAGE